MGNTKKKELLTLSAAKSHVQAQIANSQKQQFDFCLVKIHTYK